VQILRRRGKFRVTRKYRPRTALAVIIAAGALLLAAGFGSTGPLTAHDPAAAIVPVLLALLVALCASPRMVARLRAYRRDPGQRLDALLERLPNDYYLINKIALRAGRVDHVLAGPCGIVVIATRRATGHVQCDGDRWSVNGRPCKSYSRWPKASAMAVRRFLATRHPEFRREVVRTIVVFTDPRCELHVQQPEVAVVRGADLLARVVELGLTRKMDRGLVHIAAHGLAGDRPARFSAGSPSPRSDRAR
jgi:hypothetical protein